MDYSSFLIPVVCSTISCVGAVVSVLFAMRPAAKHLENEFDELSSMVEKMAKEARKERMSRVRSAAMHTDQAIGTGNASDPMPDEISGGKKAILRQRYLKQIGAVK